MNRSTRYALPAAAALAALLAVALPARAQFGPRQPAFRVPNAGVIPYPVNPNGFLGAFPTAQQQLFNSRVIGRSIGNIPPYAFGYNPYPTPIIAAGPVVNAPLVPPVAATPYATLSTSPYGVGAPYGATLATDQGGYSLSTTGNGPYINNGGYGFGGGGYGGFGFPIYDPSASQLQGLASYTQAQGNYLIQVQQARMSREQANQARIDTARKQIQFEQWYESMKMTAPKLRDIEAATELDRARKDPPSSEVWSGKSLNELLKSARKAGQPNLKNGPQIDLTGVSLENVNLTDNANKGNAGLLRSTDKDGKFVLYWPEAFDSPAFQDTTKKLTQSMSEAVGALKRKGEVPNATLSDVRSHYNTLEKELAATASTDKLSLSNYIAARRYMRELDQAVKLLGNPKAAMHFDQWTAKGRTVSELLDHMLGQGLEFAPATAGNEAAYTALYQALRAYEVGLQQAMSSSQK